MEGHNDTLSPSDLTASRAHTSQSPTKTASVASPRQQHKSLEDDDLALARIMQEQERAFYLLQNQLRVQGYSNVSNPGSQFGDDDSPHLDDADLLHPNQHPTNNPIEEDDFALAARLQREEQEEAMRRLYAAQGIDMDRLDEAVQDADIDNLGYQDLNVLGEVAGKVSKGLKQEAVEKLHTTTLGQLRAHACTNGSVTQDKCCVCQLEYEDDHEVVMELPCGHIYHQECIAQWLGINKVCPVCNREVTESD